MNDIAKQAISEKLRKACKEENLTREEASVLLGLKSKYYGGFIASENPKQRDNVSMDAWERVRDWTNSGDPIRKYAEKNPLHENGKSVVPEGRHGENPAPDPIKSTENKVPVPERKRTVKNFYPVPTVDTITVAGVRIPFEIDIVIKLNGQEIRL